LGVYHYGSLSEIEVELNQSQDNFRTGLYILPLEDKLLYLVQTLEVVLNLLAVLLEQ
jgi:hypothetical protein